MSRYRRHLERDEAPTDASPGGPEMPRAARGPSGGAVVEQPDRDPSEPLARQIAITRSAGRTPVLFREQTYELRASEVQTLATVGAFRVVRAEALPADTAHDPWHGDLAHLRSAKLIAVHSHVIEGERVALVTLSHCGKALLQHYQTSCEGARKQQYYSGLVKPRELAHDAQLYDVYRECAHEIEAAGGRVQRIALDYELKRQYQQYLQANNKGKRSSDGRPDRTPTEIRAWAARHALAVVDGHVKFPDVRIEYLDAHEAPAVRDVELSTGHYTGRQRAAKAAAGFHMRHAGGRLGGARAKHGATPRNSRRSDGAFS
jgi:hypothetical protein